MLEMHTYVGEVAILHLLSRDASELVREQQEFRIATTEQLPFVATLSDYAPRHPEGALVVVILILASDGVIYRIPTSEIRSISVLSTRRMTSALAYRQMLQMERATGIVTA